MVPNTEKLMEAFISGLPRSIEGNVISSKPQTFEKAINIAQRLMDQIIKHNFTHDSIDHKRKFDDKNITDNNYTRMIATTTIKITTTITTITMITTSSRIGSKKPLRLMFPPMGIIPDVKDAPCIT
nr:reverse transcriptase domain-containing protein [Tanacetum cinerariifolium]